MDIVVCHLIQKVIDGTEDGCISKNNTGRQGNFCITR